MPVAPGGSARFGLKMGVRSSVDVVYSWSFQGRPWLCKVAERQMLRPSFVPPPPIRILRDLTPYRVDLVTARTAEKQRVRGPDIYRSLRPGHDGGPDRRAA